MFVCLINSTKQRYLHQCVLIGKLVLMEKESLIVFYFAETYHRVLINSL